MDVERSVSKLLGAVNHFWFGPEDARVYGLLRISLACAGLGNLAVLWPERHFLFAGDGALAPIAALRDPGQVGNFSVFHWTNSHVAVTSIFVLAALALVALGLGIAPRAMAIVTWLWHLQYTRWAFFDLGGWDNLLRAAFFILALCPAGDPLGWWQRHRGRSAPSHHARYGLVLMRWQVLIMYVGTVWLKVENDYWRRGEVLEFFHVSVFSSFDMPWLFDWPATMAFVTYATLIVELALPFLLLEKRTRALGFLLGIGLHGWIAISTTVTIFSIVTLATYAAFLDGDDIDRLSSEWQRLRLRLRQVAPRAWS